MTLASELHMPLFAADRHLGLAKLPTASHEFFTGMVMSPGIVGLGLESRSCSPG
jgi:hypothetical protein